MRTHHCREKHGVRWWLNLSARKTVRVELNWWTNFCHAGISCNDEGWTLRLAFPPVAIWITLQGFPIWRPRRTAKIGEVEYRLVDDRECEVNIHNWTLHIYPWRKSMEWNSRDPWWVQGISFDIKRFVLGREECTLEVLEEGIPVLIPMPEGNYHGTVKIEQRTWKRPRWFSTVRKSASLDIPKGIPHAGKGENSWDCGDDGLFGIGGSTVEEAIGNAVESVLRARRRYGMPSESAITKSVEARP